MEKRSVAQAPRSQSPAELKRIIELDRGGTPYLVVRDDSGEQVELVLDDVQLVAVGRDEECELSLCWDNSVSRVHAELMWRAGTWLLLDDGLSRNGSYVNGERVHGRRRLRDADVLLFGATSVLYREPTIRRTASTSAVSGHVAVHVSPAQRKVLVELCRPFADGAGHAVPSTNRAIAASLVLSDEAVKSHMRALFGRFGIEDLPQNAKRARLVEIALQSGIVAPHELL